MFNKIVYKNLPLIDINPVVLNCHIFDSSECTGYEKLQERRVRDYELEYFFDSQGSMYIDDVMLPIHKGDVVLRRPGQHTQGIMPYSCYFIAIDLANTIVDDRDWYKGSSWERADAGFQTYYKNSLLDSIPTVFHVQNEEKYRSLFDMVYKEYINPSEGSQLILKSLILHILYQLYQDSCNPAITMLQSPYGKIIKKTIDYINENINQKLTLKQLSDYSGLSPNYYHKIFTQEMKITPNNYIIMSKLNKAKDLLIRTNLQIYNIAYQCGFDNVSYFSYLFKKTFHITPADFRNRHSYMNMS